jgi:CHAT domain-containing protein
MIKGESWKPLLRHRLQNEQQKWLAKPVKLMQELYQALIAPVEGALEGTEELLIVPHDLLFEVPWAALTDADGGYPIERYVRVARKAAEARQAADKMQQFARRLWSPQNNLRAPSHGYSSY